MAIVAMAPRYYSAKGMGGFKAMGNLNSGYDEDITLYGLRIYLIGSHNQNAYIRMLGSENRTDLIDSIVSGCRFLLVGILLRLSGPKMEY